MRKFRLANVSSGPCEAASMHNSFPSFWGGLQKYVEVTDFLWSVTIEEKSRAKYSDLAYIQAGPYGSLSLWS